MKRKPNAARVRKVLKANHQLALSLDEPGFPLTELEDLQGFQRSRLARSYADLRARERYRPATEFFLEELYGGLHFRERDQQVEAVMPIMVRMLPDHMLRTMADAFRLQELSLLLDIRLAREMRERGVPTMDLAGYVELYPVVPRVDREEQIQLIYVLGIEISELVRHRIVLLLSRAMRGPANAAGFGALQRFLESGLYSFRAMGDSNKFMETIRSRETLAMDRLYAGDPDPFRL